MLFMFTVCLSKIFVKCNAFIINTEKNKYIAHLLMNSVRRTPLTDDHNQFAWKNTQLQLNIFDLFSCFRRRL